MSTARTRYGALRKAMRALFALTSTALVAAAVWVIHLNTEVLERRTEREALNLRTLLVDQIDRSFSALDVFLEDTAPAVSSSSAQAGALGAAMRRAPSSHLRALLVLDAQGNVISSAGNLDPLPPRQLPDTWTAQRAESPAGTHVSTPIEWPETRESRVLISRPLEPGRIGRYLAAVVDLGFFGEMLTPLDIGANSGWFVAIIRGRQASLLARFPDYPGAVGREIELSEARLRAIVDGVMPLPMPAQFTADSVERLLYYGRLRDQPLYAGIGLSRKAIREEILLAGLRNGAVAALALLVVALLFWSLLRQIRLVEAKDADEMRAVRKLSESEARFARMIEASPQAITITALEDGTFIEANRACLELYGYARDELIGRSVAELGFWPDPQERRRFVEDLRREGALNAREVRLRGKDRKFRDLLASAALIEVDARPAVLFFAMDISARRRTEDALRTSEERLRGTLENTPGVAVQWFDRTGRILFWNRASERLYGVAAAEAVGRGLTEIGTHTAEQNREILDMIARIERSGSAHGPDEITIRARSGAEVTVLYTMFMIPGIGGGHTFVCMDVDITERKRAEERIQHLATRDALTDLPNRLLLVDRLSQAMAACKREGTQLAVLFMDLDRFKLVNDTLGHEIGDRLLREVADRIAGSMRQEDTLARLGGDEFVLVAYGLRSPDAAAGVARKILSGLTSPFLVEGHTVNMAASIGVSIYPGDAADAQGLLRNADIAMYQAKEHGRGRYEYYSEQMNARLIERQLIETKLRAALAEEALYLVYQPKVDIRSGRVTGAEALLRWDDAELGPVSPLRFIGVAEETGLIVPLGRWVMMMVLRQLAAWLERGWSFPVAINLSVRQFTDGLVDDVERSLREARVDPKWIELEITENIFLNEVEENVNIVERLSRLGTAVTLDDFGTGYSSFSYLKRFAVSGIKIDQSFVRDVTNSQDASIVGAIIAMAHNLGMKAVAEGVESKEQLKVLKDLGCDEYQGYLFSRPLRVPEFEALLEIPRGRSGRGRTLRR